MPANTVEPLAKGKAREAEALLANLSMLLRLVVLAALALLGSFWLVNTLLHLRVTALNPAGVAAI